MNKKIVGLTLLALSIAVSSRAQNVGASPGAWAIIDTKTASAHATIDFTTLSTVYTDFMVVISDVVPATDSTDLWARASVASTFKSGASDYAWALHQVNSGGTENAAGDAADSEWHIGAAIGSASGESVSLILVLFNPSSTDNRAKIMVDGSAERGDGVFSRYTAGGRAMGTIGNSAVDGIQFLFSSGNIASGSFTLYGRCNN